MKILYLGNSHTYYNDMPQIFANLCKERGKDVEVVMQSHPGVTLEWHLNELTELRFALMYGGYDYIIIQQGAHPGPPKEDTIRDVGIIIEMAKANGVKPIVALPWAEKRDPAHQKGMYDIYETVKEIYDVPITVTGRVFEDVFYNYPEIDMYWRDGEHASMYGSYARAMCEYALIFGESVKGFKPYSYNTYQVSDEDYAKTVEAFNEYAAHPESKEAYDKNSEMHKKYIRPVMSEKDAFVELDKEKVDILQTLVDKYAFGI